MPGPQEQTGLSHLTSFQVGSVESLCTLVLALLTKYPKESTSREQ